MFRWHHLAALAACFLAFGPAGSQEKKGADTFINAADAGPDFLIQGEYASDKDKLGAQVVALGDGKFDVYFLAGGLPGAGWDQKTRVKAAGKRDGDKAVVTGPCTGEIAAGTLKGTTNEGIAFSLKRVLRESPTANAKAPSGALVLFDGTNADQWKGGKIVEQNLLNCGTSSQKAFSTGKLHIEFRTPFQPKARGQGRGNSGVYLVGKEIQVLDSFGLNGENNECGGYYSEKKPAVNMCFPPLSWQTYDVEIKDGDPGFLLATVYHNGVKIHEDFKIKGAADKPATINLQNHGNPVAYRNIWFVPAN